MLADALDLALADPQGSDEASILAGFGVHRPARGRQADDEEAKLNERLAILAAIHVLSCDGRRGSKTRAKELVAAVRGMDVRSIDRLLPGGGKWTASLDEAQRFAAPILEEAKRRGLLT